MARQRYEIWRPVPGFEGRYEVSDLGRVRGLVDRQQKPRAEPLVLAGGKTVGGYRTVVLCDASRRRKETRLVHRVVLEAFVGPCPTGMQSRHFPDHDRANNRLDNLSYCSARANSQDILGCRRLGRRAKLTHEQVRYIRASNEGVTALSRRFGCTTRNIYHVKNNESWTQQEG